MKETATTEVSWAFSGVWVLIVLLLPNCTKVAIDQLVHSDSSFSICVEYFPTAMTSLK